MLGIAATPQKTALKSPAPFEYTGEIGRVPTTMINRGAIEHMNDWTLFFIGLAILLAFSFTLNTFFLGSFISGMKRYLLGRIIGGTIKDTRIDHEVTHRTLGLFGLQTRNGGPGDEDIHRLTPKRWQEVLTWICYVGMGIGFAIMIYAKAR
ncbi:hypothetical protein GB927_018880 [Shinella sp. CPCC 100929]|uniref:Uncharacterized protein n=2 Tax=Shinella lacus TaxID=2654216 RepID=A0ABT1RAB3_9HYPH|nr:hypothetical protein [Shinella lacus]